VEVDHVMIAQAHGHGRDHAPGQLKKRQATEAQSPGPSADDSDESNARHASNGNDDEHSNGNGHGDEHSNGNGHDGDHGRGKHG
jgi:hypothetical protein